MRKFKPITVQLSSKPYSFSVVEHRRRITYPWLPCNTPCFLFSCHAAVLMRASVSIRIVQGLNYALLNAPSKIVSYILMLRSSPWHASMFESECSVCLLTAVQVHSVACYSLYFLPPPMWKIHFYSPVLRSQWFARVAKPVHPVSTSEIAAHFSIYGVFTPEIRTNMRGRQFVRKIFSHMFNMWKFPCMVIIYTPGKSGKNLSFLADLLP